MNWRWPYTPGGDLFRSLTWLFLLLGWGYEDAKYWWEESW